MANGETRKDIDHVLSLLDNIIDNPDEHTPQDKERTILRATRSSYSLHRTIYSIMEDNRDKLTNLNSQLFGDTEKMGAIHELSGAIEKMNIVLKMIQWIGIILAGAILSSIGTRLVQGDFRQDIVQTRPQPTVEYNEK